MVGEVGVVGLVHHLAAHALTTNTTNNNLLTLFNNLSNTKTPLSVYHPFSLSYESFHPCSMSR